MTLTAESPAVARMRAGLAAVRTVADLFAPLSPAVSKMLLARSLERWDPSQARVPKGMPNGGEFLNITEQLQVALHSYRSRGDGKTHPFAKFKREQLMKAAKDRGLHRRRGVTEDELRDALLDDLRNEPPSQKITDLARAFDEMGDAPTPVKATTTRLGANSSVVRQELLARPHAQRRAYLDGLDLTQAQARQLAKDLGVKGPGGRGSAAGRASKDDALDLIVGYFRDAEPEMGDTPASTALDRFRAGAKRGDVSDMSDEELGKAFVQAKHTTKQGRADRELIQTELGLRGRRVSGDAPAPAKAAKKAAKAGPPDLDAVTADLDMATSREEAHALLAGMSGADLKRVATRMGVSLTAATRKDQMADRIVEHSVGNRLNSATIRRGAWTEHPDTDPKFDVLSAPPTRKPRDLVNVARKRGESPAGAKPLTNPPGRAALLGIGGAGVKDAVPAAAKPPRARKAATPSSFDAPSTAAALRETVASRADGEAMVAAMRKPELVELGRELSLPGAASMSMARLRREIVEGTVGRRLDSQATRGFKANMPGGAGPADLPDADVRQRVQDAYARLVTRRGHGDLVSLVLLRAEMADIPREQQDRILKQMDRERIIHLEPDPNQRTFTPDIREAAVKLGGEDKHFVLWLGGPNGGGAGPKG